MGLRQLQDAKEMGRFASFPGHGRSRAFPTLALVAWSFCNVQVAFAGSDAEEGDLDPTDPPVRSTAAPTAAAHAAAGGHPAPERLMIGIGKEGSLAFGGPAGGSQDEVLFEMSSAHDRFRCIGEEMRLAVETSMVANRRLLLWTATSNGFFDHLVGKDEPDLANLHLTYAQVQIDSLGMQVPVLLAELEEVISDTSQLEVGADLEQASSIKVKYDCRGVGTSMVTLLLRVSSKDSASSDVCLRWKKDCSLGWDDLVIKQMRPNSFGNSAIGSKALATAGLYEVYKEGKLDEKWVKRMTEEGTQQAVTKFQISSRGIMRLRSPRIDSNQRLVSVEALGPLIYADGPSEVGRDPVILTVTYACNFEGFGDVTLLLEKDTLSLEDEPEKLELRWRKHCGVTRYKHLQAARDDGYAPPAEMEMLVESQGGIPEEVHDTLMESTFTGFITASLACTAIRETKAIFGVGGEPRRGALTYDMYAFGAYDVYMTTVVFIGMGC